MKPSGSRMIATIWKEKKEKSYKYSGDNGKLKKKKEKEILNVDWHYMELLRKMF